MSSAPLTNNPAISADLTTKYNNLYLEYKLAVNGAHFSSGDTPAGTPLWDWQPPAGSSLQGFAASESSPILKFLAAPRLSPELAQLLPRPEQEKQQQH